MILIYFRQFNILALLSSLLFSIGCANIEQNIPISTGDELWGNCVNGRTYRLQKNVFIIRVDLGFDTERLALSPEREFDIDERQHGTPLTVAEYLADPHSPYKVSYRGYEYFVHIEGAVRSGTGITCSYLLKLAGFNPWLGKYKTLTRFANIEDGAFKDVEVEIDDLTKFCCELDGYKVNNINRELLD